MPTRLKVWQSQKESHLEGILAGVGKVCKFHDLAKPYFQGNLRNI